MGGLDPPTHSVTSTRGERLARLAGRSRQDRSPAKGLWRGALEMRANIRFRVLGIRDISGPWADVDANLVGTWVVSHFFGKTWRGTTITMDSVAAIEIEITEHDGPTFVGVIRWQFNSDEHGLHDGTQPTVEQSDTTIRRYRLVDANTLEVVAYEAGPHAVVVRETYTRR